MEDQKVSAKQVMINYGGILGLTTILISVSIYAMGKIYDPHWSVGMIRFAIMITIISFGIKKVKESNENVLSLGEALKTGLGIALIAGLVSVVYTYIFTTIIEPDYFTTLAQIEEQKWLDANLSEKEIEDASAMMKKMSGSMISSAISIVSSLFFGFIISLFAGLIMKQTNQEITSI